MYAREEKLAGAEGAAHLEGYMLSQKILQFDVISMEFLSLRCRRSS